MKAEERDLLIEMKNDLKWIRLEIEGNGKPGLISRISSIEQWKWIITGALIILAGLFGVSLGGII